MSRISTTRTERQIARDLLVASSDTPFRCCSVLIAALSQDTNSV